jgi:hypothetical protein
MMSVVLAVRTLVFDFKLNGVDFTEGGMASILTGEKILFHCEGER